MFDYSYNVARIAALESRLVTKEVLSRLSASSADEAVKQLAAAGYGDLSASTCGELVSYEQSKLRSFLFSALPEELSRILVLPYDCHNLKVLLKCCVLGKEPEGMLYDNTVFDAELAYACCRGGEFSLLSDRIAETLNRAYDSGELSTPFGISVNCDLAFYKEIAFYAGNAPEIIKKYVKYEADHTNYVSYLRAFSIGLSADAFKKMLLPGGFIPAGVFCAVYEAKPESIRPYTFGYETHDGITAAEEAAKTSVNAASDALDASTEALLEAEKYEINSAVPVFIYNKKKIREARLIRTYFAESEALWKRK